MFLKLVFTALSCFANNSENNFQSLNKINETVTLNQILTITGYSESVIVSLTQESLEGYLYHETNQGKACGLEEFTIEGYKITEGTIQAPTRFEVQTTAAGPVNDCAATINQACYTIWKLENKVWDVAFTECEEYTIDEY